MTGQNIILKGAKL